MLVHCHRMNPLERLHAVEQNVTVHTDEVGIGQPDIVPGRFGDYAVDNRAVLVVRVQPSVKVPGIGTRPPTLRLVPRPATPITGALY